MSQSCGPHEAQREACHATHRHSTAATEYALSCVGQGTGVLRGSPLRHASPPPTIFHGEPNCTNSVGAPASS